MLRCVEGGSVSGRAGPIATLVRNGPALSASTHARPHAHLDEGAAEGISTVEGAGETPNLHMSQLSGPPFEVGQSQMRGVALDVVWTGYC